MDIRRSFLKEAMNGHACLDQQQGCGKGPERANKDCPLKIILKSIQDRNKIPRKVDN